jgi:hypothetical protein
MWIYALQRRKQAICRALPESGKEHGSPPFANDLEKKIEGEKMKRLSLMGLISPEAVLAPIIPANAGFVVNRRRDSISGSWLNMS